MNLENLSDEMLLVLAGANTAAFDVLYRRHEDRVKAYIRSISRDAAAAEEIANDVFVRLIEVSRKGSFDPERGTFKSLLYAIAHNRALDEIRRNKRRAETSLDDLLSSVRALPRSFFVYMHDSVHDMLKALPGPTERAIALMSADGLSIAEIAHALGISISTVNRKLALIRDVLKQFVSP